MADTRIGRDLRALRERRGWGRETLAHHSGVSWAAISQIEAGRRTDPRLSTVVALADALGVALDQLSGRATPADRAVPTLQHLALLYATDAEFADATVPFLTAGLERDEAALVVSTRSRIRKLRQALGAGADRVVFEEASVWYSSPPAALDRYRLFLHERIAAGHRWVRILGEPVWAGRSAREIRVWARYESMLNLSMAGAPASIVCPYDAHALPLSVLTSARRTHPTEMVGTGSAASPTYENPETFLLDR